MQKSVWSLGETLDHGMRRKEVKEMTTKSIKRTGRKKAQQRRMERDLKPRKDVKGGYTKQKPDGSL
jgi:hypothetical protein